MDFWLDAWVDGWMGEWMNGCMDIRMVVYLCEWMDVSMCSAFFKKTTQVFSLLSYFLDSLPLS